MSSTLTWLPDGCINVLSHLHTKTMPGYDYAYSAVNVYYIVPHAYVLALVSINTVVKDTVLHYDSLHNK